MPKKNPVKAQQKAASAASDEQPQRILVDEAIGWMENGILRQFHEGQVVSNPADIRDLIKHGAQYLVVTHE